MSRPSERGPGERLAIIDEVGAELRRLFHAAQEREAAHGSRDFWVSRAWRWRPLAAMLLLVVAVSAAAAAGVFESQPSGPLSGAARVGAGPTASPLGPARYSVSVTPNLNGGAAGWCVTERVRYPRRVPLGNVAAIRALLIDAREFFDRAVAQELARRDPAIPLLTPARARRETRVINTKIAALIAGLAQPASIRRTAAFRRRYAAFLDRLVPAGYTSTDSSCGNVTAPGNPFVAANGNSGGVIGAAITSTVYLTAPRVAYVRVSPTLTLRTRAGRQLPDGFRIALDVRQSATGQTSASQPAPVALDRQGHVIRSHPGPIALRDRAVFWHTTPPPAACEIHTAKLAGVEVFFGEVVPHINALPQLANRTFLSCAYTEFAYRGYGVQAAILLDAQHPDTRPAPLPDATPVKGHRATLNEPAVQADGTQHITGRRIGNAWLVVESASPLPQRLAVLDHLGTCVRITGRCP